MLAKSKTSAYINALALIAAAAGASMPFFVPVQGIFVNGPPPLALVVVLLVLYFLFAWPTSRWFIYSHDESHFGWGGLLRWTALGLLMGLFSGMLHKGLLGWLPENGFFYNIAELIGWLLIYALSYGLVFRRNFFTASLASGQNAGLSRSSMTWFLVISGLFLAVFGWLAMFYARPALPGVLLLSGIILLGGSALLLGATMRAARRDKLDHWVDAGGTVLGLAGIGLIIAGAVMMG